MSEPVPTPKPVPPHLFAAPQVVVSPRRIMDVPDVPGEDSTDFLGATA